MECYKWKFKSKKPIEIVGFGDWHLGSPEADIELIKSIIQKIKKRKAYCLLMGDLIDAGLKDSPGTSMYESTMSPQEQIKLVIELLKPIKKQILLSHIGNHSFRIWKNSGVNASELIASALECKYASFQALSEITINKQKYVLFSTHGSGSGGSTEQRVNSFKKYIEQVEADVFAFGHVHDCFSRIFRKRKMSPTGIVETQSHMVFCGNMLNYGGYGEMKGYAFLRKGCPLIKLYPNKHQVEVDLNWFEK